MKIIKKTNLERKFSILLISLFFIIPNALWAWDGEDVPIINIRPTDEFRAFHAANPEKVQKGLLNAIHDESAIIDGKHIKISSTATFLTWNGEPKRGREFVVGSLVGFETDELGYIITLWDLNPEGMKLP